MIVKYEKEIEGLEGKEIVECAEGEADYIHYCYQEEGEPCKRVKIIK